MPKRACLLCSRFAVPGGSRCEVHGGLKSGWSKYKAKHPARAAGYQSEAWRGLRDRVKREEPSCRRCGAPTTDVDHIVPLADGGGQFDRENLQGLCHPCHKKKTGEDNRRRRTKRWTSFLGDSEAASPWLRHRRREGACADSDPTGASLRPHCCRFPRGVASGRGRDTQGSQGPNLSTLARVFLGRLTLHSAYYEPTLKSAGHRFDSGTRLQLSHGSSLNTSGHRCLCREHREPTSARQFSAISHRHTPRPPVGPTPWSRHGRLGSLQ